MSRPLSGKRVMVTREITQAEPLIKLLEHQGAACECVPLIRFEPTYHSIESLPAMLDWLFFTSSNTVRFFEEWCKSRKITITQRIASVGPKTSQELRRLGYSVDFEPSVYNGKTMVNEFIDQYGSPRIGIVCGESARREIPEMLTAAGIYFKKVVIYRTIKNEQVSQRLIDTVSDMDAIFFTSPSTVSAFEQFLPLPLFQQVRKQATAVAIGDTTAHTLEQKQFEKILFPNKYTVESMVQTYTDHIRKGGS